MKEIRLLDSTETYSISKFSLSQITVVRLQLPLPGIGAQLIDSTRLGLRRAFTMCSSLNVRFSYFVSKLQYENLFIAGDRGKYGNGRRGLRKYGFFKIQLVETSTAFSS